MTHEMTAAVTRGIRASEPKKSELTRSLGISVACDSVSELDAMAVIVMVAEGSRDRKRLYFG